jgi:hypothetical protein
VRTETELSQIALDFVSDCTTPQSVFEYAAELEQLGSHGAKIPAVRANKWKSVIEQLITEGKLHEVNGLLVAVVESKQEFEQLPLF